MTLRDYFDRYYYQWYGCRRGKHCMKFSGCIYCGSTDYKVIAR